MNTNKYTYSALALLACCNINVAIASSNAIPANLDAARVEKNVGDKLERSVKSEFNTPSMDMPAPLNTGKQGSVQGANTSFVLKKVVLKGNQVFDEATISAAYKQHLGQRITLIEAYDIARKITQAYRKLGYVLSYAVVPAQKIYRGKLIIQIFEGYVDKVKVDGRNIKSNDLLLQMAQEIKNSRPLHKATLERYSTLMNDLPGINVKVVFQASATTPGASELVIKTTPDKFTGYTMVDNRGSKGAGKMEYLVGGFYNDIFGYDRLTVNNLVVSPIRELQFTSIKYDRTLNKEGLMAFATADYAHVEPGVTSLRSISIKAFSRSLAAGVNYPWIRGSQKNINFGAKYHYKNTRTNSMVGEIFEDQVHSLNLNTNINFFDGFNGYNSFKAGVTVGLNDDNDNPRPSRAGGQTDFTKADFEYTRIQGLGKSFTLTLGVKGQLAGTQLLSGEQFGVGGSAYGKAYDGSEISGDSGHAVKAELAYRYLNFSKLKIRVQPFAFTDHGRIKRIKPAAGEERTEDLMSVGAGIRMNIASKISINFEAAKPVEKKRNSSQDMDVQYFFSVSTSF